MSFNAQPNSSAHSQAAEAYLASSVENAPPIKIVRMLYQGAIRFLLQAENEDAAHPKSQFVEYCSSADAIVAELRMALEPEHANTDVVDNLGQLYLFCESQIQNAMMDRTPENLPAVRRVLRTLLEAWDHVDVQSRHAA